jgi:hypothetical protein
VHARELLAEFVPDQFAIIGIVVNQEEMEGVVHDSGLVVELAPRLSIDRWLVAVNLKFGACRGEKHG